MKGCIILKFKRKTIILALMSIIMLLFLAGCKNNSKDGIVAEIDGYQVTQEQFDKEFEMKRNMNIKQFGEDFLSQELEKGLTVEDFLREELLFDIIHENILRKELSKLNMAVTEEDIDRAMNEYYISKLGGEEGYKEYLDKLGITDEYLRKVVYRGLMYQRHSDYFFNQIDLSEETVREYYEKNKDSFVKVRASHILVKTEEKGKEVLERLKEGADFAELAAIESIDTQTSIKGGDLGYFTRGSMVEEYKEIENTAFSLKVGEISGLIKTTLGYHIVMVEDRKESFEDLKDEVINALKYEKYQEELDRLTKEADVQIYMDLHSEKNNKDN